MQETGFDSWIRKIPWQREWQPPQYSCLGDPMDTGAWQATVYRGCKELDTTERLRQNYLPLVIYAIYIDINI